MKGWACYSWGLINWLTAWLCTNIPVSEKKRYILLRFYLNNRMTNLGNYKCNFFMGIIYILQKMSIRHARDRFKLWIKAEIKYQSYWALSVFSLNQKSMLYTRQVSNYPSKPWNSLLLRPQPVFLFLYQIQQRNQICLGY